MVLAYNKEEATKARAWDLLSEGIEHIISDPNLDVVKARLNNLLKRAEEKENEFCDEYYCEGCQEVFDLSISELVDFEGAGACCSACGCIEITKVEKATCDVCKELPTECNCEEFTPQVYECESCGGMKPDCYCL